MKAAIVILNWNGRHFLETYLPILIENTPADIGRIIIADNGSTDGSVQMLKEQFKTIQLIEFDKNYGFTGGYNRALEQIDAEYFILLNSDIRVSAGWLDAIIHFMDNNPQAGICMPKILSEARHVEIMNATDKTALCECFEYAGACGGFIDKHGFPFCRGRILSHVEDDNGQYDNPIEIFWASGACMAVRSEIYRNLDGLDESFFAHMEEIDFCWRAKLLGYHVWAVPQSCVYHVGGGTLPNNSPHKLYLNYRNNLLMLYKNLPAKENSKTIFKYKRNISIFKRIWIDNLSAVVYLLQGKFHFFKAVVKAHRDFKKMKGETKISPRLISYTNSSLKKLSGVYCHSIILSFFAGKKDFTKLKYGKKN